MRLSLILIFMMPLSYFLQAQEAIGSTRSDKGTFIPQEQVIYYKLSDKIVTLKIWQYGEKNDFVYINLHDDEITSVIAAKQLLEEEGGLLIEVENDQKRNIRFRLHGAFYSIDPNRIFSKEGISKSLTDLGRKSEKAIIEVEKLGQRILELIPEEAKWVIALHNNSEGWFSATEYAAGNKRTKESRKVYISHAQDADDFFLTTDAELYEKLADKGYNSILQDNKNCTDDGSLSVYFGRRNLKYVNCETEHGKTAQYIEMLKALMVALTAEAN